MTLRKPHDTAKDGTPMCGAKNRRGEPCRQFPVKGRSRCKFHGGRTPRGPSSPHYKHGFFSQVLPKELAKLVRRAAADPELASNRSSIAFLDVHFRELLSRLGTGVGCWEEANNALLRLRAAAGEPEATSRAMTDLELAVWGGWNEQRVWDKLGELMERRDKLLTGEVNRHKVTADMISADRVATMMVAMLDALRAECHDRELLKRVEARWEKFMGYSGVTTRATALDA